jgi:hypothetical protein
MSSILTAAALGSLMNFAAWHSGLPVPNRLPEIGFVAQCDLQTAFYDRPAAEVCNPEYPLQIAALYLPDANTILFAESEVDPTTVRGKSIIVHELVHFVQDDAIESGSIIMQDAMAARPNCLKGVLEAPAYAAQFAWLRENKVDPWTTTPINDISLFLATNCQSRNVYDDTAEPDYETVWKKEN